MSGASGVLIVDTSVVSPDVRVSGGVLVPPVDASDVSPA